MADVYASFVGGPVTGSANCKRSRTSLDPKLLTFMDIALIPAAIKLPAHCC